LTQASKKSENKTVNAPHLPEVKLNLPIAIGLLIVILAIGAGSTYLLLQKSGQVVQPTPVATATLTPTVTLTPTEAPTSTPQPTPTLLPPLEYTIKAGDTCGYIAAIYHVSIQAIADLNKLAPDCGILREGQILLVPQPTPTPSPMPTSTLSSVQSTDQACQKDYYTVVANDTLGGIAAAYNVDIDGLRAWNGLSTDNVWVGQRLVIPLCERLPTAGPTPTPTTPPPYPAANLLLPVDGAAFNASNDSITLQWASVGALRSNEAYAVTVEDVTEGGNRKLVAYVTDTSYVVTSAFRPTSTTPHVIRWSIQPVRQTGTDSQGKPIWAPNGAVSTPRVLIWSGVGGVTPTP
jgi:LysM repeat protein